MPKPKEDEKTESLKGWQPIATFLGQTVSVAERWAHEGMPVQRNGQVRTRLAGRIAPLVWGGNQLASRFRSRVKTSTSVQNSNEVYRTFKRQPGKASEGEWPETGRSPAQLRQSFERHFGSVVATHTMHPASGWSR